MGGSTGVNWSASKAVIVICLFAGAAWCIFLGLKPFLAQEAEQKDLANCGLMLLIIFFMFGFFKVRKDSRFIFWSACFALILYADAMFLFYDTLFLD